jgi:hypothetical protein
MTLRRPRGEEKGYFCLRVYIVRYKEALERGFRALFLAKEKTYPLAGKTSSLAIVELI